MDIEPGGRGYEGVVFFSKAMMQAVLLFGEETYVLAPRMERAIGSFQHRVALRLTGMHPGDRGLGFGNTRLWMR